MSHDYHEASQNMCTQSFIWIVNNSVYTCCRVSLCDCFTYQSTISIDRFTPVHLFPLRASQNANVMARSISLHPHGSPEPLETWPSPVPGSRARGDDTGSPSRFAAESPPPPPGESSCLTMPSEHVKYALACRCCLHSAYIQFSSHSAYLSTRGHVIVEESLGHASVPLHRGSVRNPI